MSLQSNATGAASAAKPKTCKARYTVLSLIWLALLLSFLDRMVMSVSLPFIGKDLNLDTAEQGLIISAFFIGYAAFQIPGGFLADRFGARKIMAIGIAFMVNIYQSNWRSTDPAADVSSSLPVWYWRGLLPVRVVEDDLHLLPVQRARSRNGYSVYR